MDYRQRQIAEIYDCAYPQGDDADFYLSLTGPHACSVLDLGCGTGTLCCALAERGHRVTGVDPAAAMLEVAKRKPHAEKVEWIESSAQTFKSDRRFDLIIMTGHAFQIMLRDADMVKAFETMRCHLKDNRSRVAFETRNPQIDWVVEWGGRRPLFRMLPEGVIRETLTITDAEGELISFQTSYEFPNGSVVTNSTLRFSSREHIESLMASSGLAVRDVLGDWHFGPFEAERSREIIFIAEKKMQLDAPVQFND